MYKVSKYPPGAFSWADNSSSDPAAAKSFYVELFGWEKNEIPIGEGMTYTVFQLTGEDCAAMSGMMPDQLQAGIPSHWNNYVTVDDIDGLVEVVKAHGGAVLFGPEDIFDSGRMMGVQDPTGAALNLWQPQNTIGARIVNTAGAMCWNELWTWDVAAAQPFYAALFGWEYIQGESAYVIINNRGRFNGGIMEMDASFGETAAAWQVFFSVVDIDASIERAAALGGSIRIPKTETPGVGQFAFLCDPAGAFFCLIQLNQIEAWETRNRNKMNEESNDVQSDEIPAGSILLGG